MGVWGLSQSGEAEMAVLGRSRRARHFGPADERNEGGSDLLPHPLSAPLFPGTTLITPCCHVNDSSTTHKTPLPPFLPSPYCVLQVSFPPVSLSPSTLASAELSLCNDPVRCANENTKARKAKALDAVNAIRNASQYNARTAASKAGESSLTAKSDCRSFSMSCRQS
jgi:hypothetical protein